MDVYGMLNVSVILLEELYLIWMLIILYVVGNWVNRWWIINVFNDILLIFWNFF